MKKFFVQIIKYLFAQASIELAGHWPLHLIILVMRQLNEISLSVEQLQLIAITIKQKAPCKLLVFGLGNDSLFWLKLNRGGVTVFLEDNKDWFEKVTKNSKDLIAFLINYNTQRVNWLALLKSPSLLDMRLPKKVEKEQWDIIIVDAPSGLHDKSPGRMKSIYFSSKLIKHLGDIFVHDCDREVENIYSNNFIKKDNLKVEVKASSGLLRHYHIINPSTLNDLLKKGP